MTISQDQLDAWKRLALDVRERMHLRYAGDCKCGKCQLVPLEMLIAVRFALPSLAEEAEKLREALRKIAAFDDVGASAYLKNHGSYGMFDEPGSVRIAREALDKTTTPLTTTPEG